MKNLTKMSKSMCLTIFHLMFMGKSLMTPKFGAMIHVDMPIGRNFIYNVTIKLSLILFCKLIWIISILALSITTVGPQYIREVSWRESSIFSLFPRLFRCSRICVWAVRAIISYFILCWLHDEYKNRWLIS